MAQRLPAVRGPAEAAALVERWRGLPGHVLWRLRRNSAVRRHRDDAESAAWLGLYRAAELYREDRGYSFSTYAFRFVLGKVMDAVRAAERQRGRERPYDFQRPRKGAGPHLDPPAPEPAPEFYAAPALEALGTLPDRLRLVLVRKYGLDGRACWTERDIGRCLGVCPERVRQLKEDGLALLRAALSERREAAAGT